MKNKDEVALTYTVYKTYDYDQFKYMTGNRKVDPRHVNTLARKMEKEGNLMYLRPVEVNENGFVIDGQNRIGAAERNKMPVYYLILKDTNVGTTISFNTGMKNWSWLDFAHSWKERKVADYAQFIDLYDEYKYSFGVLLFYSIGKKSDRSLIRKNSEETDASKFRTGDFRFTDLEVTKKLLKQYSELVEVAGMNIREFAYAAHSYMRTPSYNHQQTLHQIAQHGDGLHRCYTVTDFLIELETIAKA